MPQYIGITISALLGFAIALYIFYKKSRQEKLVCIIGKDCNKVIESEYSKLWGIRLEFLGMIYYGLVALYYGVDGALLQNAFSLVDTVVAGASILAFLLSLYLTVIQFVVLRDLCEWCLASGILSTVIFLAILL